MNTSVTFFSGVSNSSNYSPDSFYAEIFYSENACFTPVAVKYGFDTSSICSATPCSGSKTIACPSKWHAFSESTLHHEPYALLVDDIGYSALAYKLDTCIVDRSYSSIISTRSEGMVIYAEFASTNCKGEAQFLVAATMTQYYNSENVNGFQFYPGRWDGTQDNKSSVSAIGIDTAVLALALGRMIWS